MRYRKLSPTGDYVFGTGPADFLINSPEAVAQAISTRLKLWTNEWFLDLREGTPWTTQVVGKGTAGIRDQVIRTRILLTEGVNSILSYNSTLDPVTRLFNINATVDTIFGLIIISVPLAGVPWVLGVSSLGGPDQLVPGV